MDFAFPCRLCRYKRCLLVGMSINRIKHGRYSKEKRLLANLKFFESQKKCSYLPNLMTHTDADDLLVRCCCALSKIKDIYWPSEIENVYERLEMASSQIAEGTFPMPTYMEVFEVTGVELDNRKDFWFVLEKVMEVTAKRLHIVSRDFPGLAQISDFDLKQLICSRVDEIFAILMICGLHTWNDVGFVAQLNGKTFITSENCMADLTDKVYSSMLRELLLYAQDLNLTFEELTLILALNLVHPNAKHPHFENIHNSIILAFTRYLQKIHGESYHLRLGKIVNFLAYFTKHKLFRLEWRKKHKKYIEHMYSSSLIRSYFNIPIC